jgi:hypothetical protein
MLLSAGGTGAHCMWKCFVHTGLHPQAERLRESFIKERTGVWVGGIVWCKEKRDILTTYLKKHSHARKK